MHISTEQTPCILRILQLAAIPCMYNLNKQDFQWYVLKLTAFYL